MKDSRILSAATLEIFQEIKKDGNDFHKSINFGNISHNKKAQTNLFVHASFIMFVYVIYPPISVRLFEKSTFFLCREDYYHPPPACQGLSIFGSRGVP